MKLDQNKRGIEVSIAGEGSPEKISNHGGGSSSSGYNDKTIQVYKRMRTKQGLVGTSGNKKTWKAETFKGSGTHPVRIARQGSELSRNLYQESKEMSSSVDGIGKSPVQIAKRSSVMSKNLDKQHKESSASVDTIKRSPVQITRQRSEMSKNLEEQCKELSVSADGVKKSPIQTRKELSLSVDGMERSSIRRMMRTRSMSQKGSNETIDVMEENPVQLRKIKSMSSNARNESSDESEINAGSSGLKSEADKALDEPVNETETKSSQLIEAKSASDKILDEYSGNHNADTDGKISIELRKEKDEMNVIVDEVKILDESDEEIVKGSTEVTKTSCGENCKELGECEEKVSISYLGKVKSPPKLELTDDDDDWDEEMEEEVDEEIEIETEKQKSCDVEESSMAQEKAKKIVVEEKKIYQSDVKPVPVGNDQLPHVVNHPRFVEEPLKTEPNEFCTVPNTHSKLQSLVDLVMWRDASKSAFVFGFGMFIIVSSSYTTDLNISFVSVVSYVALVYLAAIFLFRSVICRGAIDVDNTGEEDVVGEEEAVWLIELILPYLNEFLLKLRALFSGDPATTMKLAMLLFALARLGSSITIWKMTKLGFFGVFTVPKICSSYSSQLTTYGTIWMIWFIDTWESCSHKKAVGFFIFTLVWNLSSTVVRIWAVFILVVAFRYYQVHFLMNKEDEEDNCIYEEASGGKSSSIHHQQN